MDVDGIDDDNKMWIVERDHMVLEVDMKRLSKSDPQAEVYEPSPGYTSSRETPPSLFRHVEVIKKEIYLRSGPRKKESAARFSLSDFITVTTLASLGKTRGNELLERTPAFVFSLFSNPERRPAKVKRVVMISGVHAREWFSQEVALLFVLMLTRICVTLAQGPEQASKTLDPWILKADLEIVVVPVVNLFGYFCTLAGPLKAVRVLDSPSEEDLQNIKLIWRGSQSSGHPAELDVAHLRGLRKNSPLGTDINRNYPRHWGNAAGASRMPLDDDFCGSRPASEPETQAIMGIVHSMVPDLIIDLHSFGNDVLKPGGLSPDSLDTSRYNVRLSKWITLVAPSIVLGLPFTYKARFIYPIAGCLDSWLLSETDSSILTMEIGGSDFSADSPEEHKKKVQMPERIMNFIKVFYFERPMSI